MRESQLGRRPASAGPTIHSVFPWLSTMAPRVLPIVSTCLSTGTFDPVPDPLLTSAATRLRAVGCCHFRGRGRRAHRGLVAPYHRSPPGARHFPGPALPRPGTSPARHFPGPAPITFPTGNHCFPGRSRHSRSRALRFPGREPGIPTPHPAFPPAGAIVPPARRPSFPRPGAPRFPGPEPGIPGPHPSFRRAGARCFPWPKSPQIRRFPGTGMASARRLPDAESPPAAFCRAKITVLGSPAGSTGLESARWDHWAGITGLAGMSDHRVSIAS
jgi:hypothetical protein